MFLAPYHHSPFAYSPFHHGHGLLDLMEVQRLQRELGVLNEDQDGTFNYKCNVHGFKPDEIEVHQEGDNLIISAHQKHSGQHENYERVLKRVVRLPQDVKRDSVRVELNERDELVVHAEKKAIDQAAKRKLPIAYKQSEKPKDGQQLTGAQQPKDGGQKQ
jgi:HSP20 family molecular chaperone IbpA